jgi:hypothetical protein
MADRLVVSNNPGILKRSLTLALRGRGVSAAAQPLLRKAEADAATSDIGAALDGQPELVARRNQTRSGWSTEVPLGVRSLSVAGSSIAGDLEPELWGPGTIQLDLSARSGVLLSAPGLEVRALWQAVRPKTLSSAQETALAEDLDALVGSLGRGLVVRLGWEASGRFESAVALRVGSRDASHTALLRLLRDALATDRTFEEEALGPGEAVICPRRGKESPAFCISLAPETLSFATSRAALLVSRFATGAEGGTAGRGGSAISVPRLIADLTGGSGRFTGSWKLEP